MSVICSRKLKAVYENRVDEDFVISIEAPVRAGEDWLAKLNISDFSISIFGVDSWQAVTLALKYIMADLISRNKTGWKFYAFGSNVEIDINSKEFDLI